MSGYPHTLRPELHKALIARGIDYWVAQGITFWNRDDGCECLAYGYVADGVPTLAIKVVGFTDPEQAIAATLGDSDATGERQGVETCHSTSRWTNVFKCSMCGFEYDFITDPYQGPHYCPNCGRRVVE